MICLEPSPCTNCGQINDTATCVGKEEATLSSGDICICAYCSHIMAYDENLHLRNLTDEEIIEIAGDPLLVRTNNLLSEFRKWKEEK